MSTATAVPAAPDDAVRACVEERRTAFLDELAEWLCIPSVSADPEHAADVRRSAEWLAGRLTDTGFPVAEVWETEGAPAVFAEWPADDPGAPTVLIYGHHDVQPAALADGWHSEPFQPEIRDGRLYARGAADDKGQIYLHTLGVRVPRAATGRAVPAVPLKLLIEGEEESGSPRFAVLFLRISVASDGWHAPDERAEMDLLTKGAKTAVYSWGRPRRTLEARRPGQGRWSKWSKWGRRGRWDRVPTRSRTSHPDRSPSPGPQRESGPGSCPESAP